MADQTFKTDYSTSDGLRAEVSIDNGSSWLDFGVLEDGATFTYDFDAPEIEKGNAADPPLIAKNQTLTMAPSELNSWDSEVISALSNGLISLTAIAGTPVAGGTQLVASGDWSFDKGIYLTGQNASGLAPTINSVTGSIDGAGTADDWDISEQAGGWYLVPRDGTNFTTEVQTLTIDSDYTPAAMNELTAGSSSHVLESVWVRFTHHDTTALTTYDFRITCYRVYLNSGLAFTKLGAKSGNNYDTWTASMVAKRDSGLADGSQLFKIEQLT